jgi:hypothetical protein
MEPQATGVWPGQGVITLVRLHLLAHMLRQIIDRHQFQHERCNARRRTQKSPASAAIKAPWGKGQKVRQRLVEA